MSGLIRLVGSCSGSCICAPMACQELRICGLLCCLFRLCMHCSSSSHAGAVLAMQYGHSSVLEPVKGLQLFWAVSRLSAA